MRATRIAILGGLAVFGLVCYLAARGMAAATELLITTLALVGMIVGGSYLSGRLGLPTRSGRSATTGAGRRLPAGAHCPGSDLAARAAHRPSDPAAASPPPRAGQ